MKKMKQDLQLDEEEKEILTAYEAGDFISIFSDDEKKKLMEAATTTIQKNKNINIRLSSKDLLKLKAKSVEKGIPYQTIIASLVHQYTEGKIKVEL